MARFSALAQRWGQLRAFTLKRSNLLALLLGALVLLIGLGRDGLWEPWEMDRADLARNLAAAPEAVVAVTRDGALPGAAGARLELVSRAAASLGIVSKAPEAGTPAALRAALDLAKTRTVASLVVDVATLVPLAARLAARPEIPDPGKLAGDPAADPAKEAWQQAGKLAEEALRYAAGASFIVLRGPEDLPAGDLKKRLAVERWKAVWADLATRMGLAEAWSDSGVPQAAEAMAVAEIERGDDPIQVLDAGDVAGITAALKAGASSVSGRVAFKDKGDTIMAPPLETWLRAAGYRVFGVGEWTTRMPGVVLALIALWVLLSTVRTLWNPRTALLSGVVLVTLPLFFGQARIISGEPGFILGITLVASGLLLSTRAEISRKIVWGYLVTGLVTGLLAKGVFALALFGGIAVSVPLVSGSRRLADWAPAAMFVAAAGLFELLARGAAPGSMWSGLDFTGPLFSEGPSAYSRTFDMLIRSLGFGLAPWSPLVVVAIGLLTFGSLEARNPKGLIVVAWFFLPIVAIMVSLKLGNQFMFVGVGAAAIAVGIMLDQLLEGQHQRALNAEGDVLGSASGSPASPSPKPVNPGIGPQHFVALALLMMYYIMRRELKLSPEPLVGFLTYDPPFAKEGTLRFPEAVDFAWLFKQSMIVAAVACLAYFGGFAHFLVKAIRWFRRTQPFLIASGLVLLLGSFATLGAIGRFHGMGMGAKYADSIQPAQKALVGRLMSSYDPMLIIGVITLLVAFGVVLARWIAPGLGRGIGRWLPDLRAQHTQRLLWLVAAGLAVLSMLVAVFGVQTPDGYWSELLFSAPGLFGLIAAAFVGVAVWALRRGEHDASTGSASAESRAAAPRPSASDPGSPAWLLPMLAAIGVVGLLVATQVSRDIVDRGAAVTVLTNVVVLSACALLTMLAALVPLLLRDVGTFVLGISLLLTFVVASFIAPLVDRGTLVAQVIAPTEGAPLEVVLNATFGSGLFLLPAFLFLALLGNFAMGYLRPQSTASLVRRNNPLDQLATMSQQGWLVVVVVLGVAFIGVATHVLKLEKAIAVNVSQKHILDTWREKAGDDAPIYKHGSFATQGRRDANFYTADMPEIRDRQAALKVLLGQEDQVLDVETPVGGEVLAFPGWNKDFDRDANLKRDVVAIRGFATAVGDSLLTDATQSWAPKSLVGRRLLDASGRAWPILDNDATSVRIAPEGRLSFALTPRVRAYYAIDSETSDIVATAATPVRRALLLPADQLSDLNFAWRQLSGGRHLPVLDGSSYRVLLTTSWLEPEEPQRNRLALATYTDKTFAALTDKQLKREVGNFEDTVQVVGYSTDKDTVSTGEMLKLTVYYKTLKLVKKSLKVFIHMDKTGGGARIAADHWPLNPTRHGEENKNCGGCYRTDHWLVGDIVADTYDVEIPEGNTGEYMIWVGLYQPGPDTRLVLKSWDQKRMRHDGQNRLGLGTLVVK